MKDYVILPTVGVCLLLVIVWALPKIWARRGNLSLGRRKQSNVSIEERIELAQQDVSKAEKIKAEAESKTKKRKISKVTPEEWDALKNADLNLTTKKNQLAQLKRQQARQLVLGDDDAVAIEPGTEYLTHFELASAGLSVTLPGDVEPMYPRVIEQGEDEYNRRWVVLKMLSGHQTLGDFVNNRRRLASAWQVSDVVVEEHGIGTVKITEVVKSNRKTVVHWQAIEPVNVPVRDYLSETPVGEDTYLPVPYTVDLSQNHMVVSGNTRAGKSVFLESLIDQFLRHPRIDVIFVDFKMGVESQRFESALTAELTNVDETLELLKAIRADLARRGEYLKQQGKRSFWADDLFNDEFPARVLILDEVHTMFARGSVDSRRTAAIAEEELKDIVSKCASLGYVIIMATQKPTDNSIPTDIRDLANIRICFKVTNDTISRAALGAQWNPDLDPSKFASRDKGRAVMVLDSGETVEMQTYLPSEADTETSVSIGSQNVRKWDWQELSEQATDLEVEMPTETPTGASALLDGMVAPSDSVRASEAPTEAVTLTKTVEPLEPAVEVVTKNEKSNSEPLAIEDFNSVEEYIEALHKLDSQ